LQRDFCVKERPETNQASSLGGFSGISFEAEGFSERSEGSFGVRHIYKLDHNPKSDPNNAQRGGLIFELGST
jgi:hypothetical protein